MSTSIVMPQLGESVAEGVIGKWLKAEGDRIEKDEPIVEVITDKVNAEIPSPVAGTLVRITQPEGATVTVGEEIALIGDGDGSGQQPVAVGAGAGNGQQAANAVAPVPTEVERRADAGQQITQQIAQSIAQTAAHADAPSGQAPSAVSYGTSENGRGERVRSSPLVRRLAEQHGINLAEVPGTGIGGRVSKQDIMQLVEGRGAGTTATVEAPSQEQQQLTEAFDPGNVVSAPPTTQAPTPPAASPSAAAPPPAPAPAPRPQPPVAATLREAGPNEELVPISPLRKMIANRMVQSKFTIPHATTMMECDMTNVVRYRESKKNEFRQRENVPLSYVAFVIKATVEALKEFPMVNAEWADDNIIMKRDVNINVAVDAPDGLTTPVIHHADERSLAGLSKSINDLATRARNKKLTVADMQGGTFTVNNTGALGSVGSVSIINYPQAGILTANAIVKRPVVVEQDGADLIAVRSIMNLSFSFDHRLLDGGTAASFVNAVKGKLEAWPSDYPMY